MNSFVLTADISMIEKEILDVVSHKDFKISDNNSTRGMCIIKYSGKTPENLDNILHQVEYKLKNKFKLSYMDSTWDGWHNAENPEIYIRTASTKDNYCSHCGRY